MAWKPTAETIAALAVDQIKNLRKNAEDRQLADIVALCDAELGKRKPVKVKKEKAPKAAKVKKPKAGEEAEETEEVES